MDEADLVDLMDRVDGGNIKNFQFSIADFGIDGFRPFGAKKEGEEVLFVPDAEASGYSILPRCGG